MVEVNIFQCCLPLEHCPPVHQRKVWLGMDPLGLVRLGTRRKVRNSYHLTDYLWNTQTLSVGDGTWNMPGYLAQPEK